MKHIRRLVLVLFSILLAIVTTGCAHTGGGTSKVGWGEMADALVDNPELKMPVIQVVSRARNIAASPIVKRVYTYADLGKHRTQIDSRAGYLKGQPRQEWFALAMADAFAANILLNELPLLAFAYRYTGDEMYLSRIITQLEEVTTWSPIQRPGWSLYAPSSDPVPEDFWDGSWLATGTGIRAITDTLELLPAGSLDEKLMAGIEDLLRAEIETISEDWQLGRGWFRRGEGRPGTNQWVLPTEGLVRACLVLGRKKYSDEYELGVTNLFRALDIQGSDGEFNEGISYALMTVNSMLSAARAMAVDGDARALDHEFIQGFSNWAVQHLQPGRMKINAFDAGGAKTPRNDGSMRGLLSTLAVFTLDPAAVWALENLYDGPTDTLTGVLARTVAVPDDAPELFAFFDGPARRVNWRDSWEDNGTGVWIRGGHPVDAHDHHDRGHVNYIVGGRTLLIEAGTPNYSNPNIHILYSTVIGHNVLDVEGITPGKNDAPVTVESLDETGGDVIVDVTACYPGIESWERNVAWDTSELSVYDRVAAGETERIMRFRWHIGTYREVIVNGSGNSWTADWPYGVIELESSIPIEVTVEMLPDNTVALGRRSHGDYLHPCVVVRTASPVKEWDLVTRVTAK